MVDDVRAANRAFYEAFASLEIARMDAVWSHEGQVTCVHPGWPLASGWDEVKASWISIFANTTEMRIAPDEEQIEVHGDLAWVVCIERLSSGAGAGEVLATNVFRREGGAWRIAHHHASTYVRPVRGQRRSSPRSPVPN